MKQHVDVQRGNEKESKSVAELNLRCFTDFEGAIKVEIRNEFEKEIKRVV